MALLQLASCLTMVTGDMQMLEQIQNFCNQTRLLPNVDLSLQRCLAAAGPCITHTGWAIACTNWPETMAVTTG
jgi:hypothetical protein